MDPYVKVNSLREQDLHCLALQRQGETPPLQGEAGRGLVSSR